MSSSERDDALQYLLSKLKSEDGWSCANLAWNEDRLTVIADQFGSFDGTVKSKLLLSFLAMTPRVIHQCRDEMLKLLRLARRDGNEWVRLFAAVLAPFPESQTISVESSSSASEVVEEIGEFLNNSTHVDKDLVPQEYPYLGNETLKSACSFTPPTNHAHFTLRSKPRASSQLRTEILHRAEAEMANPSSLIKNRLLNRKNSFPATTSFVSLQRSGSMPSSSKTTPIPGLLQRRHREKGTKLLEIDEVPMAGSRKKRRISEVDPHARLDAKRVAVQQAPPTPTNPKPTTPMAKTPLNLEPPATPTPDYAAGLGLGPDDSAIQPHTPTLYTSHLTNPFTPLQSPTTPSPTTPTLTTPIQFKTTPTTPGQFKPTFHQLSQLAVTQQTSSTLQQPATPTCTVATPTTTSAPLPRPAFTQASVTASQQPPRATQSRDRRALIQARLSQLSSPSVSTQKHQILQGSKVADLLQTALLKKVLPSQEQPGTSANIVAGTSVPTSVSLPQLVQQAKNEPVLSTAAPQVTQLQARLQVAATAELTATVQPVTTVTSTAVSQPQLASAVPTQAQLATSVTRPAGTTGLNLSAQQLVAHQQQLVNQQQALFNRLQQQAQRGAAVAAQAQVNPAMAQAQPALTAQQQRQLLAIQQSQLAGQQQARAQTQPQPSQPQAHPSQPQAQQALQQQQQQQAQEASGSRLKISRSHLAIAEDIFREAPHLSKQQRILILAFMAGSRSNPFPGRDVVTFKLSSRQMPEVVDGPQGNKVIRTVQLETVFEMNYTTGTWRKLQVKRVIE